MTGKRNRPRQLRGDSSSNEGDVVVTPIAGQYAIGRITASATQAFVETQPDLATALQRACELAGDDHRVFLAHSTRRTAVRSIAPSSDSTPRTPGPEYDERRPLLHAEPTTGAAADAAAGELLFEFLHGHDRILCDLGDDGEVYGVEARFFRNETFEIGRRFERRMDPSRTPREMAIEWAEEWRKAIEVDRWYEGRSDGGLGLVACSRQRLHRIGENLDGRPEPCHLLPRFDTEALSWLRVSGAAPASSEPSSIGELAQFLHAHPYSNTLAKLYREEPTPPSTHKSRAQG